VIGLVAKSVIVGLLVGAICTVIYSLLTASSEGRNVLTGEPMHLKGVQAIYVHVSENSVASYLFSLVRAYLIFSIIVAVVFGCYLGGRQ